MKKKSTQFRWLVTMLLLVTAMAMPKMAWAEITPTPPSGKGTADSPYQIGTAAELYWFAALVNGDTNVEGVAAADKAACAVLTADITVTNETWTPIGVNGYKGTFDGQGHTISGLYFNNSECTGVGLFGSNSGTIKNVGVIDSYIYGSFNVGGVCGNNSGTITGCYNMGSVSGSSEFVGGVCGNNSGTITGCYNMGSVSGESNSVGGVCGANNNGGTITSCYNMGSVSGRQDFVGGVCGINSGTITGCYNKGSVSGDNHVGGVCGYNTNDGIITGCYNTGTVSGRQAYVGGVCGANNNGGTITGCYNTGTVSGLTNVGGVCGENGGTITDCYYLSGTATGGIDSNDVAGSAEAKTTTQFNSGEVAYLLNGSRSEGTEENPLAWYQNISISSDSRDTYPVLTGTGTNTVYQVKILCGGTVYVGKAYSNTNKDITVEHILIGPAVFNSGKKIYSKICQREGCGKTLYYADAAGTIKATPNAEETAFAVASYTLEDPTAYNNQAVFTATNFIYTRVFSNTNWTTWYVPFELKLTEEICSKFAFSRINNVHQYDTNDDGKADKTVVESFRQTENVTLKANYPYLVKALSENDLKMELNLKNVQPALAEEAESIDCQSVDYKYVFTGTYNKMDDSGSGSTDPYTLCEGNKWLHFRSLSPMRHYLTIQSRDASSASPAAMRSILLSIIGEEDTTGIVKIYDEQRRASETYDLSGRRLPAGSQRGLVIENGKVVFKK